MRKVTMPEPLAWVTDESLRNLKTGRTNINGVVPVHASRIGYAKTPLITTAQAEAYADARVREARQWISVETLLPPDDGKEVLAIHSDGEVEIVYGCLILETHCDRAYTHWMPIPNHPTVE